MNSVRGPGEEERQNPDRPARLWREASREEQDRFGKNDGGHMIFAARVLDVRTNGDPMVLYMDGATELGEGVEREANVMARVQMPWHPRHLHEQLIILMRRNVGFGQTLENLEVRWRLVARIMRALTSYPELGAGPWREGGSLQEPMHKDYDPRLFDVLSEEEVLAAYAPRRHGSDFVDIAKATELEARGESVAVLEVCRTGAELHGAGFKVSVVRSVTIVWMGS